MADDGDGRCAVLGQGSFDGREDCRRGAYVIIVSMSMRNVTVLVVGIPGLVTGKPGVSFYIRRNSQKERRVKLRESIISIGCEGEPGGFV